MLIYFIIIIYVEVIFVSKFCEFCGAQIGDDAASCPVCNATPSTNNITASDNETVSNAGVTATPVTENVENNNASTDTAVSPTATANTPDSKDYYNSSCSVCSTSFPYYCGKCFGKWL